MYSDNEKAKVESALVTPRAFYRLLPRAHLLSIICVCARVRTLCDVRAHLGEASREGDCIRQHPGRRRNGVCAGCMRARA